MFSPAAGVSVDGVGAIGSGEAEILVFTAQRVARVGVVLVARGFAVCAIEVGEMLESTSGDPSGAKFVSFATCVASFALVVPVASTRLPPFVSIPSVFCFEFIKGIDVGPTWLVTGLAFLPPGFRLGSDSFPPRAASKHSSSPSRARFHPHPPLSSKCPQSDSSKH